MFVELVDSLRCVRAHEPAWLVAAALETVDRDIVRGVLGCHVCRAEYPIVRGVADFRGEESAGDGTRSADAGDDAHRSAVPLAGADAGVRIAALLDLAEPGGFVALAGAWSGGASALRALVEGVHVLGIDARADVASGGGISLVLARDDLPLRDASCRGIALDGAHASPGVLASAAAALRVGGRLVAPADTPVPDGVTLLAADERHWVGEKEAASGPVVPLALGSTVRR